MNSVDLDGLPGYRWIENGQSNFSGPALELFQALDRMFQRLAAQTGAVDHYFPTFIQAAELRKLDYFSSFPHLVSFPVALQSNEDNLKSFVAGPKCDDRGQMHLTETAPVCDCLTPAACYHFYIHYQGQDLPGPLYLTTRANCYRREAYYAPLQRQWNFNMREIVCLGSSDEVTAFLTRYRELASEKCTALGLSVGWETATDPFFDPGQSPKFLMQTVDPVKSELVLNGGLSIGSVNSHKSYFGDAFEIRSRGAAASSGCIAFGLERWIYAIVAQHGTQPAAWPMKEICDGE